MAQGEPSSSFAVVVAGALTAEVVGTFMFTFSGTATVLAVHQLRGVATGFTAVGDISASIAFAFGVVAAVYAVGKVSGAHVNPAVTLALAAVGRFPWRMVPGYLAAQLVGGLLAGLMDWFMFPALREPLILGSTHPGTGVSWWTACFTEFVITAVLMIVVMVTAVDRRTPGQGAQTGLAIGFWVGAAIFLALPISGGSLNPARTLGPDIVALQFPYWWIYVVGPVAGAVFGAALWHFVLSKGSQETVEGAGQPGPADDRAAA